MAVVIVLAARSIVLGVQSTTMNQSAAAAALHQAPDECRWTGSADTDLTLVCRLRTINSELENTNFSVIQPQNTIRLRLECNEALFFQSSISAGSFQPLVELRSLAIHYCKIGNLTRGALQGLHELRNLTIRTHNTDWSTMRLVVADDVFTGIKHIFSKDITKRLYYVRRVERVQITRVAKRTKNQRFLIKLITSTF